MTLQQLQYFLAAAEHGSFSRAAAELHLAQPSLSEQVRRLEAEFGVALFQRVGRGLALTEAGRALRPHAERTLAEAEAARASVVEVRELRGGTAAFGTWGTSRYYIGVDLVAEFRQRHPDVRVRLLGQNSAQVVEAVQTGALAAGAAGRGGPGRRRRAGSRCPSTTAAWRSIPCCATSCSTSARHQSGCAAG